MNRTIINPSCHGPNDGKRTGSLQRVQSCGVPRAVLSASWPAFQPRVARGLGRGASLFRVSVILPSPCSLGPFAFLSCRSAAFGIVVLGDLLRSASANVGSADKCPSHPPTPGHSGSNPNTVCGPVTACSVAVVRPLRVHRNGTAVTRPHPRGRICTPRARASRVRSRSRGVPGRRPRGWRHPCRRKGGHPCPPPGTTLTVKTRAGRPEARKEQLTCVGAVCPLVRPDRPEARYAASRRG